jgi:hypothetical protein
LKYACMAVSSVCRWIPHITDYRPWHNCIAFRTYRHFLMKLNMVWYTSALVPTCVVIVCHKKRGMLFLVLSLNCHREFCGNGSLTVCLDSHQMWSLASGYHSRTF